MLPSSEQPLHSPDGVAVADELSALGMATAWINSPPLTPQNLKGRVVLVQFWTFTCINWLRTEPYTRAWAEGYRGAGLVVIGVHTPEFAFEHDLDNVRRQTKAMNVEYPVAVDNDYAVWRGFHNQYWPALYLIDANGQVRHHQFGEGEYAQSERLIQQVLMEAGAARVPRQAAPVVARGIEAPADWANLRSAENYVGSARAQGFASPGDAATGRWHDYTLPSELRLNQWALAGNWTINENVIVLNAPNGRIAYCFHSRDLHLVMGPPKGTRPVRFRVLLDGKPATTAHGADLEANGKGVATEQRLYQLVRQSEPIGDHLFQIEFLDPGIEVFVFTFG